MLLNSSYLGWESKLGLDAYLSCCYLSSLLLSTPLYDCGNEEESYNMIRPVFRFNSPRACAPVLCGVQSRGLLTLSYAQGPTEPPLLDQTVPQHFASIVSKHGDQNAVISRAQHTRLTYEELDQRSSSVAAGLQAQGVKKGMRVAVSLGNNIEFAVTTYALFKLGAILVPLNPAFNSPQVISALSHLSATHLIIGTETNLHFKPPRENISLLKQISPDLTSGSIESASVPSLQKVILVDNSAGRLDVSDFKSTTSFNDLLYSQTPQAITPDSPLHRDDIINIQFTSGTTALPKAACLSHTAILNNGYFIGMRMGLTPADIIVSPPPLYHCFGSILGYMASATHGSSIVFPSEAFSPSATLIAVQEERATALYGVATMFTAELELLSNGTIEDKGFEHLRTGIAAGSSVPSVLMGRLHDRLNLTGLTICYGMTETAPVSCMTTPDDPLQKRLDSVGRLLPHVHAKVVSVTDPGRVVPIGERGELAIAGYNVMSGYWGDKARTAEVRKTETDEQGREAVWMYTGDEAQMDADGYVHITGRIKDLIIRGGENIHPLEVENVLFAHPQVSEASVVGIPDEKYGECVAAFVVVHGGVRVDEGDGEGGGEGEGPVVTKQELRDWVRGKLSGHLVPKYIFWTKNYPKTPSGKIKKFELKTEGIKLRDAGKGL
ncbi:hypothetical protein VC83_07058 [Pseudogymnoascus destructans]|uniref:NRPS-like protein biosynthetic cluster n=2 Tax=Pseudogymnoascus destructans TaxID=655981 RepID=L8FV26_PSED2|nr:uncharacterized protein VC83_07058 [Pseudogymnoascus destructans]ELR04815.1 hypothetical protein GMDG_07041 [Pseudogymnoascus destructans 20631-21]OAF56864.1 hypothetical protein VC83_07058 [Pseudogymnoascus destructans]